MKSQRNHMIDHGTEVWSTFVGAEYGPGLRVALQMIAIIPIEDFVDGINKINNTREYREVLTALVSLRRLLPDIKGAS